MGLVSGVDDRALECGLEADDLLEELGSLAELECRWLVEDRGLEPHLPGAAEDLPRHKVWDRRLDHVGERHLSREEIVLVASVRVALAVRVVLVHDEARRLGVGHLGGRHRLAEDLFACAVVEDRLEWRGALWR